MSTTYRSSSRRDQYGGQINRTHSPLLAMATPWITVMLGSLTPMLPVIPSAPVLPPLGFLMLLGWRLVHPGLLPLWAGFPLGLFDDLYSGQPLGCGILLWSLALLALEAIEARFPWRGFLQDWLVAALALAAYLGAGVLFSGANGLAALPLIGPQLLLSVALFPIIAHMTALLDRLRLMRIRKIA